MSKASEANAWPGAPPVAQDGFAFADGVFFAQSSGQNRHRRATATELKEHFTSGNDKDHPAHWFEAQLIHYGLPPSKTKSVARMRLFDAVNAGNLKVPANVSKLETKLKKEWTKNDREAKKGATSKPVAQATPVKAKTKKPTAASAKRKADDDECNATAKKPKTVTPKTATPKAKAPAKTPAKAPTKNTATTAAKDPETGPAPTPARELQTARCVRGGATQSAGRVASTAAPEPVKPRTKQTAPRGNGSRWSTGRSRQTPRDPSPEPPRFATPQTARRGGSFAARGRIPAPSNDAPPPNSEFPYQVYSSDENNGSDDVDEVNLAPLGLLNGDYEVESRDVTKQWDFDPDEFQLTLTIAGNRLWGRFNLGVYEGVLLIEERPMRSSHDRVWFKWRGREDQGPVIYGDRNQGWMEFLGDGRIEGWLDHQSLSFQARRLPGQGTRSSIDARALHDEWNGYSHRLYEEENRARWR
ncbi:uncharacterized protein FTJAE_2387 [Fusarium tjaetaba]|uniref:Uncharacterized protein n=1 Tax=Fusarium tjaetaba TaxID=1567544 RepID=A0A8H5S5V1_9HYPO|nr:uncharacterized protein FTJAE_2387 [Fusarium tjaetaba]KAF5645957.1 hypothetical protein FTJAE_2387 [Fusarium tjaetaba]